MYNKSMYKKGVFKGPYFGVGVIYRYHKKRLSFTLDTQMIWIKLHLTPSVKWIYNEYD